VLGAILALPVAAHAQTTDDAVERAIKARGGRELLARVKALSWSGTARIAGGDRMIDLTLRSHVEPCANARTDSWLTTDTSTLRSMLLTPNGGFLQRGDATTAMLPAQTLHERQQYAIYGYLLLVQPGVTLTPDAGRITASRPGLPPIRLTIDADGTIDAADYVVAAPDGTGTIAEHIRFDGKLSDKGINWWQRMILLQNGMPYMTLTLESFAVELA